MPRHLQSSRTLLLVLAFVLPALGGEDPGSTRNFGQDRTVAKASSGPDFTDEEMRSQRVAAQEMRASLDLALADGATVFRIPPGDYRFDGTAEPGFHLRGRHGFTIEAEGATFWFGQNGGVVFEDCSEVRLEGLTIDSSQLPWTQGVIEHLDPVARTLIFRVSPGYEVFEGAGLQEKRRLLFFDPETRRELQVSDDWALEMEALGDRRIKVSRLSSGRVFRDPVAGRPVRVGDLAVLFTTYGNGSNVHLEACEDITLENITIHAASGFAFQETRGNGGNKYLGCRIVRRPATDRLMAARADGFHSYLMRKGPLIERCEFSHTGDDLLNIHSFFSVVLKVLPQNEILIATPFRRSFDKGSKLKFLPADGHGEPREATLLEMNEVTEADAVARAQAVPELLMERLGIQTRSFPAPAVFRVRLDRPDIAEELDLVSSASHTGAGTVIRNSHFHDGHIRGLLLKTENALVEGNRIARTGHGGIVIQPEGYWLEGSFAHGIRIVDNQLSETGMASFDPEGMSASNAAIQVGTHFGKRLFPRTLTGGTHNRDIKILRNVINHPFGFAILVTNTEDVIISGNSITAPFAGGEHAAYYDFSALPDPRLSLGPADKDILSDVRFPILLVESRNIRLDANSCNAPPPFLRGLVGTIRTRVSRQPPP